MATCAAPTHAATNDSNTLRVQLIWRTGTEFTGLYVAQSKGYYAQAGLQVRLIEGGPNIKPLQSLKSGQADIAIAWSPGALRARARGFDVVNIAQISQRPEMALACRTAAGINEPTDIRGKKIAVWGVGDEAALRSLLGRFGIGMNQVTLVQQGFQPKKLINGKVACATIMLYNEYWSLMHAGLNTNSLILFPFRQYDSGFLENGFYVRGDRLDNPAFVAKLARFLKATARSWHYARHNRKAALAIVMDRAPNLNRSRQKLMLNRMLASIGTGPFGLLRIDDYERSVRILAQSRPDKAAFIAAAQNGWTHRVWEKSGLDTRSNRMLSMATTHYLKQTAGSLWFHIFDLIGTAAFGIAGFMRARKHRFDLFGAFVLTLLPAVGGGTLRDVLIGGTRHPLYIFTDPSYIAVVCGVVLFGTMLSHFLPEDISETSGFYKRMIAFDTVGLSIFSIIGASVALLAGLAWYWAAICSALTCAGGGVLLDVVTGYKPRTFQGEPYEELGILGGLLLCGGLLIVNQFEHAAWLVPCVILVTFVIIYALRILVVVRHWHTWRLGIPVREGSRE